jgi:hypothetical protein
MCAQGNARKNDGGVVVPGLVVFLDFYWFCIGQDNGVLKKRQK